MDDLSEDSEQWDETKNLHMMHKVCSELTVLLSAPYSPKECFISV